ncbi:MAG: hypothetical protein JXR37_11090 [Kiritimatiellae bacterium]|nr:hypothetical protein [Kiritimatiellia bacterium]
MKILECAGCGHIEFEEAPQTCLVCGAKKNAFKENPDAIRQPGHPREPTDSEKKHIPHIVVVKQCGLIPDGSCTDVHVKVGEIEHVMQPDHHIRHIDYYLNHKFISRVWLSPETCHPAAGLHLRAPEGSHILALENCNVHGNWMSETTV